MKKGKVYTGEFKAEAVKLAKFSGKSYNQIARDLGVPHTSLHGWIKKADSIEQSQSTDSAELRSLRKENLILREERYFKKGISHLFKSKVKSYQFMEQHKGKFCLERMAKILKVSRSGYYNYLQTKGNRKIDKDLRLVTEIKSIFVASKSTYGSLRIHAELLKQMAIK